jgi:hypothetical protein
MVEIGAGEMRRTRQWDAVTAASVVVTIDAALFLVIAVVGVPFLLYIFADDDTGTWQRMWPLIAGWTIATVLGAACARVAIRAIGSGNYDFRRSGAVAGFTTAVAVGTLAGTSAERSPVLAVIGTLFAMANIFAGLALLKAEAPESLADEEYEPVDELMDDDDLEPEIEESPVRETVDLAPRARAIQGPGRGASAAARRRMRGRAALITLSGVQMSRRPRR